MLSIYSQISKNIVDAKKELNVVKSFFGREIMLRVVYEATNKRNAVGEQLLQLKSKLEKYSNAPLLEFEVHGKLHKAVLSPIRNLVTGEYRTYDDIIKLCEPPADFSEKLSLIDSIIANNARSVYESLPVDIRNNNREFEYIKRSNTKSYLYYYKGHEKKSFGLIFVEV